MIELKCVKCAASMQLDDAFAGGTCRCSACGAIQTVPTGAPRRPGRPAPQPRPSGQIGRQEPAVPTSGLDDLADAVSKTGPVPRAMPRSAVLVTREEKTRRAKRTIAVVAALVAVSGGVWIALRGPGANGPATSATSPPPTATPAFGPLALSGPVVAYVIDKGDASKDYFPLLKELTSRSIASLGAERRCVVLLWPNGEPDAGLTAEPIPGTSGNAQTIAAALEPIVAIGRSDPVPALTTAFALNANELVLMTAKGWQLDETFVNSVLQLRGSRPTKVHVVSLGGGRGPLADLARTTGGRFVELTLEELRDAVK